MTGMSIALAALCVLPAWLLLGGCYQGVRVLRARTEAAERREAKANEERIAAEARADVLGRRVGVWSRVAGETDARAGHIAAKAAELAGERDRLREEVATLAGQVYEVGFRWRDAVACERAMAHPSGAVARALDGVERKVRGGA